jgi:hypothetical protein
MSRRLMASITRLTTSKFSCDIAYAVSRGGRKTPRPTHRDTNTPTGAGKQRKMQLPAPTLSSQALGGQVDETVTPAGNRLVATSASRAERGFTRRLRTPYSRCRTMNKARFVLRDLRDVLEGKEPPKRTGVQY